MDPRRALAACAALLGACGGIAAPAGASEADDRALLQRLVPVLRYDADETHFAQPAQTDAKVRNGDRVYGHVATEDGRRWLQYWLFYAYNDQDRGIVATGRHEGDWEMAQIEVGPGGAPRRATLAQHSWAESCDWDRLELIVRDRAEVPILYVARGSHALYSEPGTHDRPWPDPNDEADGEGREVRPELTVIRGGEPSWVDRTEPWGDSRAAWIPGEQSSPPGPRFQPDEPWSRPVSFDVENGRACGSGPPGRWWQTPILVGVLGAIAVGIGLRLRRRRSDPSFPRGRPGA